MVAIPQHDPARRSPSGDPARLRAEVIGGITTGSRLGVRNGQGPDVMTKRHDKEAFAMKPIAAALIAATLLAAGPAAALEPLAQEKHINDRLVSARIADRIRRECPTIDARILYAYGEARKLKRYAEQKGYSGKQIDAFLDDKAEKKRIYATAEDYLTRHGAKKGDAQSFCAIGKQAIADKNLIGSFLVAK